MHCNGRCQMAQELKKQEEKEQQQPLENTIAKVLISVFEKPDFATTVFVPLILSNANYPSFNDRRTQDVSFPIFHPPGVTSCFIA